MIRGEIWWCDFGIPFGSEPGFKRPVFVIQNNDFNLSKINTIIIIPLSTNIELSNAPGNYLMEKEYSNLSKDSVVVVSQLTQLIDEDYWKKPVKWKTQLLMRLKMEYCWYLELNDSTDNPGDIPVKELSQYSRVRFS